MKPRGFRTCRIECAGSDAAYVIETLHKHHGARIDAVAYAGGFVTWLIDFSKVPDGDADSVEAVTKADAQKAISLHAVLP
jgi:hypothetical protein